MGARIAAHFANAGIPAMLLDVDAAAAQRGLERAWSGRPCGFFTEAARALVTVGGIEESLGNLGVVDWIVEAVTEDLALKRALWRKLEAAVRPDAICSTNTSGLPLARIAEGFSDSFQHRFLGTHFFNPPRYLHLVELIPGPATDPRVLAFVSDFCDRQLGKGVVLCKDTPNFIANRIGCFFGATAYTAMSEGGYSIEEVDALTGSLIGLPNSATFRLLDLIGLDVWAQITRTLHEATPGDAWRGRFAEPEFLTAMLARGWIGDKSGQGFYTKSGPGRELQALDWRTLEYRPAERPRFASVVEARKIERLPERLRMLLAAGDRAGDFLWKLFSDLFLYAAERIPEISSRVVEIDRAMRWGYAHTLGPFECWDALGFEAVARRIENEGRPLPESVRKMLSSGASSFYRCESGVEYFDLCQTRWQPLEARPGIVALASEKRVRGVVKENAGAALIDIGDGVLCLEFHSAGNTPGDDAAAMIHAGIEEAARNFQALIVANEGEPFGNGGNLPMALLAAQSGEWEELDAALRRMQQALLAMKYAPVPVVAAPFGRTLGGGCEAVLHAACVQASAELSMGFMEASVGLIPAAGGCKELLLRLGDASKVFEIIASCRLSNNARDAQDLGLLRGTDGVSMNPERLIADAKAAALSLAGYYVQGVPRTDIAVGGEAGFAAMKLDAWMQRRAGQLGEHDFHVAETLAHVLNGGRLSGPKCVSEQYLLDLEREAFLSLCGTAESQRRIEELLRTGKPPRFL
jgi:3-hydroxyacyl-CoA dehydrogenase